MGVSITGIKSTPTSGAVHIFGPVASGAMRFQGAENLSLAASSDWAVGTGDFTIEWFQLQLADETSFPRIFTVGLYPTASIAVSLESGTFYFWMNGSYVASVSLVGVLNQWTHFAVTRQSGTVRIFQNGIQLEEVSGVTDSIDNAEDSMIIGSEADENTFFLGNLTNFRWIKGAAVYTGNFVMPTAPLSVTPETKLLLRTATAPTMLLDETGLHTVTNNGVTFASAGPF